MKIEKSFEIPTQGAGRPRKYPFADMQVGDSVLFEGGKIGPKFKPYIAAQIWGRNNNAKFSGRTVDNGVRIWRIE